MSRRKPPMWRRASLARQCAAFNQAHPVGSEIRVWKGLMHDGPGKVGKVVEPGAYVLSGHTPVVHVSGVSGCIALTHVAAPGELIASVAT